MLKCLIIPVLFLTAFTVSAHCPVHLDSEKVCLMLDENVLYIYGEKSTHSGPYKDLEKTVIIGINSSGKPLKFSKAARGIYKIQSTATIKKIELDLIANKKVSSITVE
jgi:hypothetical protein